MVTLWIVCLSPVVLLPALVACINTTTTTTTTTTTAAPQELRVSSWNIQILGITKAGKDNVMAIISQEVCKSDINVIQELRDINYLTMPILMDDINSACGGDWAYSYINGSRMGISTVKEQYVFVHRTNTTDRLQCYEYDDPNAIYSRPPMSCEFDIGASWTLAVTTVHTRPDYAVSEIDGLADVIEDLIIRWPLVTNYAICGDFNADGSYADWADLKDQRIYNPPYVWLNDFGSDTTTSNNNVNAYDRCVLRGPNITASYVNCSAHAINHETLYNLTYTEATDVSDHYRLQMELIV